MSNDNVSAPEAVAAPVAPVTEKKEKAKRGRPRKTGVKVPKTKRQNPIEKAFGPRGVTAALILKGKDRREGTTQYKDLLAALALAGKETKDLEAKILSMGQKVNRIMAARKYVDDIKPQLQRIADMIDGTDTEKGA